ncbi:hypothetical protein AMTRI_Chr03g141540 [Amborella trichopoda]
MWGHCAVKFVGVDAIGLLRVYGKFSWGLINVYSDVISALKEEFLSSLGDVLSHNIPFCLCGDFNFIRWLDDTSSNISLNSSMRMFNFFIERFQVFDLSIAGTKFTWSNNSATNLVMSKLDRFMATQEWMEAFPLASVKALPRLSSYHIPLLLNTKVICGGKKPFRMELGWLDESDVVDLIKATWENSITFGSMDFQLHKSYSSSRKIC